MKREKAEKEIHFVVFKNFEVKRINKESVSSDPIYFIKSTWIKKSSGKGDFNYYKHTFYDSQHNEIINNDISIRGIKCIVNDCDVWGTYDKNINSIVIHAIIIDRLDREIEKIFDNSLYNDRKFKSLFNYLKLLDKVDSHNACDMILEKDKEIDRLVKTN